MAGAATWAKLARPGASSGPQGTQDCIISLDGDTTEDDVEEKDGKLGQAGVSVQDKDVDVEDTPWICQACTFLNTKLNAPVCEICCTPRLQGPLQTEHRPLKRLRAKPPLEEIPVAAAANTGATANAFTVLLRQPAVPSSPSRAPPDDGLIPRCEVGQVALVRKALQEVGAVILRHVAGPSEITHAESLFFKWLEALPLGIRRGEPRTLGNSAWHKLGWRNTGVITNYSVGQSEFMWYLRLLPRVRQAFGTVWGLVPDHGNPGGSEAASTNLPSLITSFDGCGAHRNVFLPAAERNWCTAGGWFHVDQNHRIKPGLHSYQGVLNLYPADGLSGSTVLVPGSHRRFAEVCAAHPEARGSFVKLAVDRAPDRDLVAAAIQTVLEPGDLLVWDSRVVHCNQGPCLQRCKAAGDTAALRGERAQAPLSRLVAYIAMMPASRLSPSLASARRACVLEGRSSGHDASYVPQGGVRARADPRHRPPAPDDPLWQLVAPGY